MYVNVKGYQLFTFFSHYLSLQKIILYTVSS